MQVVEEGDAAVQVPPRPRQPSCWTRLANRNLSTETHLGPFVGLNLLGPSLLSDQRCSEMAFSLSSVFEQELHLYRLQS